MDILRPAATAALTRPAKGLLLRLLAHLLEADRRYRQAAKLRDMPDFRLTDMGITRAQAENGEG